MIEAPQDDLIRVVAHNYVVYNDENGYKVFLNQDPESKLWTPISSPVLAGERPDEVISKLAGELLFTQVHIIGSCIQRRCPGVTFLYSPHRIDFYQDPEDPSADPQLRLIFVSRTSEAPYTLNRLVEPGRRWFSLRELESGDHNMYATRVYAKEAINLIIRTDQVRPGLRTYRH